MKTYKEFIQEAAEVMNSITPLSPYRVMPPLKKKDGSYNPSPQRFLIDPKTGLGPGLQQAQVVPTSKNNQVPFKYVPVGIDTTDREEELRRKVRTMERLGIMHGGTRARDLE